MTFLRLIRLGATVAVALAAACSSSSNASVDGGDAGGGDASEEAGFAPFDAPIRGPYDAFALDDAGATSTCKALRAYANCAMGDRCAPIDAKDCVALDGIYSLAGRKAVTACYGATSACSTDAGTGVDDCMARASLHVAPDAVQKQLAADFCKACPSGGSSCAASFYSPAQGDGGSAGLGASLELTLVNDATIMLIDSTCTSNLGGPAQCGSAFNSCAALIVNPGQCGAMSMPDAGTSGDAVAPLDAVAPVDAGAPHDGGAG